MPIVDTHCHATPYWFEPVEILLDQMTRNDVDHAVLIQINGVFDNSYLSECCSDSLAAFPAWAWWTLTITTRWTGWPSFRQWAWRVCDSMPPTGRQATTRSLFGERPTSWA